MPNYFITYVTEMCIDSWWNAQCDDLPGLSPKNVSSRLNVNVKSVKRLRGDDGRIHRFYPLKRKDHGECKYLRISDSN